MTYSIIPQSADVDNLTIEKNDAGKLQVKGVGLQIYNNSVNTALIGINEETSSPINTEIKVLSIKVNQVMQNLKVGGQYKTSGLNCPAYFKIFKNDVEILSKNQMTTDFQTENILVDANIDDVFDFYIGGSYGQSGVVKEVGLLGQIDEGISRDGDIVDII